MNHQLNQTQHFQDPNSQPMYQDQILHQQNVVHPSQLQEVSLQQPTFHEQMQGGTQAPQYQAQTIQPQSHVSQIQYQDQSSSGQIHMQQSMGHVSHANFQGHVPQSQVQQVLQSGEVPHIPSAEAEAKVGINSLLPFFQEIQLNSILGILF